MYTYVTYPISTLRVTVPSWMRDMFSPSLHLGPLFEDPVHCANLCCNPFVIQSWKSLSKKFPILKTSWCEVQSINSTSLVQSPWAEVITFVRYSTSSEWWHCSIPVERITDVPQTQSHWSWSIGVALTSMDWRYSVLLLVYLIMVFCSGIVVIPQLLVIIVNVRHLHRNSLYSKIHEDSVTVWTV